MCTDISRCTVNETLEIPILMSTCRKKKTDDNMKRKDRQETRKGKERKEMSRERDQERLNKAIRCARAMHSATGRQLK
jgi:hypothetical protein